MKEPIHLMQPIENKEFHYLEDIISAGLIKLSGQTGEVIYANDIFFQLNDITKEEYIQKYHNCLFEQMVPEKAEQLKEQINEAVSNQSPLSFYYKMESGQGESKLLHLHGKPISHEDSPQPFTFLCIIKDVTRQNLYKESHLFEQLCTTILTKLIGSLFWEYDIQTQTLFRYGVLSETYLNNKVIPNYVETILNNNYIHKDDEESFRHFFESLSTGKQYKTAVIRYKDNLEIYNWYQLQGIVLFDNCNTPVRIFGTTKNIGKQEKQEDTQSLLIKKSVFVKKMNEYLKSYKDDSIQHALILIEIDNYNSLKRIHGKTLLENIMTEAVIELKNIFSEQLLGQLSPTTLAVFYYEVQSQKDLIGQLENYVSTISQLYNKPSTFSITCSMGVAIEKGTTTYELFHRKAEIALSTVQKKGGGFFDFYGHSKTQQIVQKKISPFEKTIKSSADLSFLQQTLALLENTDIENALYHYLFHVCQYYNASHAYIMLKNQVEQTLSVSYQYSTPNYFSDINALYQYPFELVGDYIKLFDSNNCYFCNDLLEVEQISPVIAESYRLAGVTSFWQYALYSDGYCIGFLGIDFCSEQEATENSQITSFYFMGKFLSYIIKNLQRQRCMSLPYHRDKLTKLLSFHEFLRHGETIVPKNPAIKFAAISCNINNFKSYNKNYGIAIGNKILKKYAHELLLSLKENELCTRISADDFALLLTYNNSIEELFSRLVIYSNNSLCNTKQMPDYYRFDVIYGICPLSESLNLTDAFQKAIRARKSLKGYTGNQYAVYNSEFEQQEIIRYSFKKSLEDGLNENQFLPYYQPKFSLTDNKLVGFEALARWKQESQQLKYPKEFLSIMEENNHAIELDFQIIQAICKDLHTTMKYSEKIYPVSINLSITHLMTTNFIERLLHIVRCYQIPLSYLKFEISEDFFHHYQTETFCFISELKELGFSITIDNFGNHCSSFNILREFDIDSINLDVSFFQNKYNSSKEQIIAKTIVELANTLKISVNVKNLEKPEQIKTLCELGCNTAQGFAFSQALPFEQIQKEYLMKKTSSMI